MKMALEWIFCPYCKEGESCHYDEETGLYTCPTLKIEFTPKQSIEATKHPNN